MSKDHSFDLVSEVNLQEVTNGVEQARKEIATRFDFKGSNTQIDWDAKTLEVTLFTESDFRLKAVTDVLQSKFVKRGVSLKALDYQPVEKATGGAVRQKIKIKQGIESDKAKEIVKYIKEAKLKVQAQIQEDKVRVQSAKIDTLQEVIALVKKKDFGIDLSTSNYR